MTAPEVRPPGWHRLVIGGRSVEVYSAGRLVLAQDCPHGYRIGLVAPNDCPICSTTPTARRMPR